MGNLENFPFPLGKLVDVPINKVVRCRWRDEEDYPEKVGASKERIEDQGFRGHLEGMPLASVEDWIEYLMVFDPDTYPTRELAEVQALTMPLDMVEQLGGHNRRESCSQLGTWYIFGREDEGKRDLIPFVVQVLSKAVAQNIYLSDNRKEDAQSAGWALGNVRKVLPDLLSTGMVKSEAYAHLAKSMGLKVKDIEKLAEINKGLADGIATPAIKRLTPDNAVEFWRKLVEILVQAPVTLERQREIIDESFNSVNPRKSIGNAFSAIKATLPEPQKVVTKRPGKTPDAAALQYAWKLFQILQQEDFEDDIKQRINEIVKMCDKLSATAMTEEDIETDAILAEIQAEEAVQESHDETAIH